MKQSEILKRLGNIEDLLLKAAMEIGEFKRELPRRKPLKKGPVIDHMTDEKRKLIGHLHWQGLSQAQIAKKMRINQGRVSEVLRGKRI